MSTQMRNVLRQQLGELRHEPTAKRIRAELGGRTVVDSTRALLVWEPRRVVPVYAVPVEDVAVELEPADGAGAPADDSVGLSLPEMSARPVLDPSIRFTVHSSEGRPVRLRAGGAAAHGFRPADPDLTGHVLLDFDGFDGWYEEDERIVSHPRDPFHRVDVRSSTRHVVVELDGRVLAESTRPRLLFETLLPTRYYLPAEDVTAELVPSATRTACAYKGEASYWTVRAGDVVAEDVAWSYQRPLPDAAEIAGLVAFFDERLDLVVDGVRRERPRTPWSR